MLNIFFDSNERVELVFDLEKAQIAPRVFELIRSMELTNLAGNFDDFHMRKAKVYVDAYHKYYPLAEGEFARGVEVRFINEFHSLWIEGEVYLKNNDRFTRFYPATYNTIMYLRDNLTSFIAALEPRGLY